MKKICTFFIAFSVLAVGNAQNWQWLNPLPQGNTLYAVSAIDSLHCFCAGGYGTVMKTSDGGLNWTILNTGTTEELTGIMFVDTLTGWTISDGGKIFHTADAGITWNLQYDDPDSSFFTALWFTSRFHGCVVGGGINNGYPRSLTTMDGGLTWTMDTLVSYPPGDVCFPDSIHGWYLTEDNIYITRDAGLSWNQQHYFGAFTTLVSLSFPDTLHGWVIDDDGDRIFRTADGGQTWTALGCPSSPTKVCFTDPLNGYVGGVSGQEGTVRRSMDGGYTWGLTSTLGMNFLYGLSFKNKSTGWAVGTSGAIFKTADTGSTWSHQTFDYTHVNLYQCSFQNNGQIGWVSGDSGKVIYTSDYGQTWSTQKTGVTGSLGSIRFTDPLNGWACGTPVIHTTDGGITWNRVPVPTKQFCWSLSFPSSSFGVIICDSGIILRTTDGGVHWDKSVPYYDDRLISVYFTDNLNGWIIANNFYDYILKTTDGGITWSSTMLGTTSQLFSIYFTDPQNGWAVGMGSLILRTIDGGQNWLYPSCNCTGDFMSVYFRDPDHGVIGGFSGVLMRTYDGGNTWEKMESGTSEDIVSLYINDGETLWTAGGNGCILTYSGIFTGIPVQPAPKNGVNLSVSPNPFNNSTVISYSLDEPQRVVITLYSITGIVIETLVNEEQTTGPHNLSFSNTQLKPGVYLCQLRDATESQTVRLMIAGF
jgi:photosystem II stability/assembly factor-like uncharacterized protein